MNSRTYRPRGQVSGEGSLSRSDKGTNTLNDRNESAAVFVPWRIRQYAVASSMDKACLIICTIWSLVVSGESREIYSTHFCTVE